MARASIAPGGTIGILGGGQLGRMTALAAARLGYRSHVYCQDSGDPAAQVAAAKTVAPFEDTVALDDFAGACDIVTLEFENIPVTSAVRIAEIVPMRPGPGVLQISQDRLAEKEFIAGQNIGTAPYRAVNSPDELATARRELGGSLVVKTRRLGYDGKGQARVTADAEIAKAWTSLNGTPAIAEGFVDFACEISVVMARAGNGTRRSYVPVENSHKDGILDRTIAPADIPRTLGEDAIAIAGKLADALDFVGVLAVEFFVTRDGGLLVNEIAPRPHNSGHWTVDACAVSQFEQLVRAVAGLPLGDPRRHSDAEMQNLIGREFDAWPDLAATPGACLHLYGKSVTRAGRKMGHVTYLRPLLKSLD
jgi:5-(carboxyamino)imidazole ribonucleotide synthase